MEQVYKIPSQKLSSSCSIIVKQAHYLIPKQGEEQKKEEHKGEKALI